MITKCDKCHRDFDFDINDTYWDFSGSGYDVQLVKCRCCGALNIIKVKEHRWLKFGNNDAMYYIYERKEGD